MAKHSAHYSTTEAPLYLKKITLENVRCFEKLEFDLTTPGKQPRMWGVVLGANGVGKTTLLRSIAMGLCDEASAAGLLREIYGEFIRDAGPDDANSERGASIHIDFFPNDEAEQISVTTEIRPSLGGYSKVRQKAKYGKSTNDFPWDKVFACGYGAGRRGFGSKDIDDYATIDAVYTLFNYDVPLQNPELVLRRIAASKNRRSDLRAILDSVAEVLQLERSDIKLDDKGVLIRGPWGAFHPIRGVGDGFQATLAWIVDFLGWALFYDHVVELSDLSGIILIDELEQHLHPVRPATPVVIAQEVHSPAGATLTGDRAVSSLTHSAIDVLGYADDQLERLIKHDPARHVGQRDR